MPIVWLAFKRASTVIGAVFLFSLALAVFLASSMGASRNEFILPNDVVLFMNLDEGFIETDSALSFSDPFATPPMSLQEIVETLDSAKDDPRVKGIVARYDAGTAYNMSHIQEFRSAMQRFKESGKFSYIYSPSYGEGGGFASYYLASAFDQIWMQPLGIVTIPGLKIEMPYFRGLMDKIGVLPEFIQKKQYKTANESLTRSSMSTESREMLVDVLTQTQTTLLEDISASRGIEEGQLLDYVERAVFNADEALEAKLINRAGYTDELIDHVKEQATGSSNASDDIFIKIDSYKKLSGLNSAKNWSKKPGVALIYATGLIMQSTMQGSAQTSLMGQSIASADQIVPAIWDAIEDPYINAIIVRIDSPGGSPVASESILRALNKAQEKGKPVYVSMGPSAASGGYWIASSADQIFALSTTLTGSIGAVGGKVSIKKLSEDNGVKWESLEWGDAAGLWSITSPFSQTEREKMQGILDHIYDSFITRVATGRNLSEQQVENIAKGRVWTGQSALDLGLIDQLGTLSDTLDYAAIQLGLQGRDDLYVRVLPQPKTRFERLIDFLEQNGSVIASLKNVTTRIQNITTTLGLDRLDTYAATNGVQVLQSDMRSAMTF